MKTIILGLSMAVILSGCDCIEFAPGVKSCIAGSE